MTRMTEPARWAFWPTAGLLALSIMLGGATHAGFMGDVILQLLAIPLLIATLFYVDASRQALRADPWILAFFGLLGCILVLQLVPLPGSLAPDTPINRLIAQTYALIGVEPGWRPQTISPQRTWQAVLSLLPPFAIFFAVVSLGAHDRSRLVNVILVMAAISLVLGVVQVAQGPESALRFYSKTNPSEAVGFFANRNHLATLLLVATVFAAAWVVSISPSRRQRRDKKRLRDTWIFEVAVALILLVALFLGLALTRSRAGLGLAAVAVVSVTVPLFIARLRAGRDRSDPTSRQHTRLGWILVAGLVLAFFLGFERFGGRLDQDTADDARWPMTQTTFELALANLPFGTGLGSFVQVYASGEKVKDLASTFANRAHNDFVEFFLETGLLGGLLLAVFAVWFARRANTWWSDTNGMQASARAIALPATIAAGAILLHSVVDYPLRTTSVATVFAALVGFLMMSPPSSADPTADAEAATPTDRPRRAKRRPPVPPIARPKPTLVDTGPQQWPDAWSAEDPTTKR